MNVKPSEKVALVTGGAQGIGKAIARRLLAEGMKVVIADRDTEAGEDTALEYQAQGDILFIPADLANPAGIEALFARLCEVWGRLDALVNNAAIGAGKPLADLTLEEWNHVLAVNLTAPMLCARIGEPLLRQTHGAIVNIASTRAFQSEANTEAYAASKGGLIALTHALAISLGPDIRVNAVSPGWIDVTPWQKQSARHPAVLGERDHAQHPCGRVGRPEDIAALVAWLLGPESGFVTGANFMADGGMTRKMIYEE